MWPFKRKQKPALEVGVRVRAPNIHGYPCTWKVRGIHLGVVGQESLVSLERLDQNPGAAYGQTATESLVPIELVENLYRYW